MQAVLADWGENEWAKASQLVQWTKNTVHHSTIKRSHYKALFGHPPPSRLGEIVENEDDVNDPDYGTLISNFLLTIV